MARIGHAGRKTIFSALFSAALTPLLSPMALISACVHAESLPMQMYSTALGELGVNPMSDEGVDANTIWLGASERRAN